MADRRLKAPSLIPPLRRPLRRPAGREPRTRLLIAGLALGALSAAAAPPPLPAQSPTPSTVEEPPPRSGAPVWPEGEWKVAGLLGVPGVRLEPVPVAFTLGVHAQQFPRGRVGLEGSVGLAPAALIWGTLLMGGRAGITVPLRTDAFMAFPSTGVGFVAAAGRDGITPFPAFHAGLAALHVGGLRMGVTFHWFDLGATPAWLVEVGGIRLP